MFEERLLDSGELRGAAEVRWQRFEVPFEYPVAFTRGLFHPENPLFVEILSLKEANKRHRCLAFIDSGLVEATPAIVGAIEAYVAHHEDRIDLVALPITIQGGEPVKTELDHIAQMLHAIQSHAIDRHSYVIGVGGGALLDAAGLASAITHRGVRHIRVPTTVLSQNDAGVGVKNAINLKGAKNYIGTFTPPWAVLNDFNVLDSLPRRERIAGLSEAVKVALIREREFFLWLEANVGQLAASASGAEEQMIRRCAQLHMRHISGSGDPFERGSVRPLDFGHWSAHKLETMTEYRVLHGEAVAIGIALDARYSVLFGLLEKGLDERIAALLKGLGFRLWHSALARKDISGQLELLAGIDEFQEHIGGKTTVTLLSDLGVGVEVSEIKAELVAQAVDWLASREAG